MSVNNETENKVILNPVVGTYALWIKRILFGLNALLMLLYVIKHGAGVVYAGYVGLLLLTYFTVFKGSADIPAVAELPMLIFGDIAFLFIVNADTLQKYIQTDNYSSYFKDASSPLFLLCAVGGILVWLLAHSKDQFRWMTGVSAALFGTGMISLGWSNMQFPGLKFTLYGSTLLFVFLIACVLWTIIFYFIVKTAPSKVSGAGTIGLVLFAAFIFLLVYEQLYVTSFIPEWSLYIREKVPSFFAWWKVILISVLLLAGIIWLYINESYFDDSLTVDIYALIVALELFLGTKLLMVNYSTFGFVVILLMVEGTLHCMKNDYRDMGMFRLPNTHYLIVQPFVAFAALILFKNGMWMNLSLSVVFFAIIYKMMGDEEFMESNLFWFVVLLCIVSEAGAWLIQFKRSTDIMMMIGMILAIAVAAMTIINLRQPGGRRSSDLLRKVICVCVLLLCLASTFKNGSKIKTKIAYDTGTVEVETSAIGKKNSLKEVHYYWSSPTGKDTSGERSLSGSSNSLTVEDEVLTIVTEDSKGVVTTKKVWFPYVLLKRVLN